MNESQKEIPIRIADAKPETSIYEMAGGLEAFRRLADAFYRRVEADEFLRPMFPRILTSAREKQALFLAQYFGGPTTYSEKRGHPRLRMRHAPFAIGVPERDAWVRHMLDAMEETGIPEPAASIMRTYFEDAATFLINQEE
jgi:hemoglobin